MSRFSGALLWSANVLAAKAGAVGMVGGQAHEFLEEDMNCHPKWFCLFINGKLPHCSGLVPKLAALWRRSPEQIGILISMVI